MGLLRADLTALVGLPRSAPGRRMLLATTVGLGLLALMWWSMAWTLLDNDAWLRQLHTYTGGDSLRALFAFALVPCPVCASWLGLSLAQRQLFETPELVLWRTAPIPGWRGAVQVLLRACFVALLWATALAAPFVVTLLSRASPGAPFQWWLVPIAIVGCTLPASCTLLAMQIVLVRFFSGPVLRLVLSAIAALAAVLFWIWLLVGLFTPPATHLRNVVATGDNGLGLSWTIDASTRLLAAAAKGVFDGAALQTILVSLAGSLAFFVIAARLHPRAVERHLESRPPLLRGRVRPWPSRLATVVRKKELAQVVQQPGALIGFLVFGVLVFALVRERVLVGALLADSRIATDAKHLGAMTMLWLLAVLLVLYAHMGRLALWDGAQWSLWTTSPASPRTILRGKLEAVALLLLWPLTLVGAIGSSQFGASTTVTLTFVGVAIGGTLAALGVLAIVGTSPRLMHPEDSGQIVQGGRTFVAAILLVALFYLVLLPAVPAWIWVQANVHSAADLRAVAPWIVAGALGLGIGVALLGITIGARNFRKLAAPR